MEEEKDARPSTRMVAAYLDGREDVEDLRARLGALTAFVGGILFEVDETGRYLAVLTGDAALLAMPVEQLMSKTVPDVLGPELGGEFVAMFARVIESGEPETLQYTIVVPRGRRTFLCEARPTFSEATTTTTTTTTTTKPTVTLLIRDVTEETELKAKLLEAERLAAMGLVAASIGHEIRQPLAFATTSVEVLEREMAKAGVPSTHAAREALDHVRDAIRRIGGIASNIGVVAPHDRRDRDETTDIRRPIEAAVDLCASELQGRARVALKLPDLPRVRANEGELCQVVANLLLNAAQAVDPAKKPGSSQINIGASLVEDHEHVRISVADNGCGIDPIHAPRVFDPFFTTKEPGHGTGLGLFVSKRIVEASGGALEIESSVNSGTTVHVTLPIAALERELPPSSVPPISRPPRRLRLLVIDDEPAFLRSLELVLEDTHEVVVCGRSADALTILRADPKRFDAVLCDLSMPEIDGVAFYRHMETLGVADRFVLMTAGAFTPHGEEFLRQAKCKRIGKPFTYDKLVGILNAVSKRAAAAARDVDVS